MSRIRIRHTTVYHYAEPVAFGPHRLVLRPREGHDIRVEAQTLSITPQARILWHRDLFGNSIATVTFSAPSSILEILNDLIVGKRDHHPRHGMDPSPGPVFPFVYNAWENAVALAYQEAVYGEERPALRQWMETLFALSLVRDGGQLVSQVGEWIHQNIRYRRREDRGVQSPMETLGLSSGSCRDMATLLLEAVRSAGLAARFASGYLDSEASAAGRAATHAWVEVYLPEHGWVGYDPTLGERTSFKHILIGVSAHPRGVMPVSGMYSGPESLYQGMRVSVRIDRLEDAVYAGEEAVSGSPAEVPSASEPFSDDGR